MKIRISDLMDEIEPRETAAPSPVSHRAIAAATLRKIHGGKRRTLPRLSKLGLIAAIAAGALCVTAAGTAVLHWTGFARTENLNQADKESLLEQATSTSTISEDQDGNVHYVDNQGNEIVLTAEEAAAAEQARLEAWEASILESTELVDLSTMEYLPGSVTELATDEAGQFDDFLLGNSHMVLLHPAGEAGYALRAGDTVTISLSATQKCYLGFGLFRDGSFVESETIHAQAHCYTYEIPSDGLYCFSIEYLSADADELTGGQLTVSPAAAP